MSKSHTSIDGFGYDSFSRFYRQMISIELECRELLERVGFTAAEINLLRALSRHPGITLKKLAESMGVTTQAISATVKGFAELKIVEQITHEQDRRKKCLHLGDGFSKHSDALKDVYKKHIDAVMQSVDESDIHAFDRVVTALEAQNTVRSFRTA